ncbi:MAG: DUF4397 domain-containing protein [Gemmatimonadaceae bacterium]
MTRYRALAALLLTVIFSACEKNAVQDITAPEPGARIKFFNFGVNAPSVNFYAGSAKMTATVSTTGVEAVTGVSYGAVSASGFYSGLEPGAYDLTGRIAATVDKDLVIATLPATVEDGKSYSFYLSGFYDAVAKTSASFIVEDDFPDAFDFTVAQVRFVHAISNAAPMSLIVTNTTTNEVDTLGTAAIAYQTAGPFVSLPPGRYNLATRYVAGVSNIITRTNVDFVGGRTYTIGARGDITVVSTTATNRPFLDNTANR